MKSRKLGCVSFCDTIVCGDGDMESTECVKVSSEEFRDGLDNGDLFDKYGDLVRVEGTKSEAVAMLPETYEKTRERIRFLEKELGDPDIKYYIYEFEAEERVWELLNKVAVEREMTLNELFISAFEKGMGEKPVVL